MAEVIVVGGGHAGVEAALACARKGHDTILCTMNEAMIASMPCNPSVGGPAKGIVVREIDALGGEMGKAADATALQFKMLNLAKGPGVQSLRVQSDKIEYHRYMLRVLRETAHLTIREGICEQLIVADGQVAGIIMQDGERLEAKRVILTTGTYMSSCVMVSDEVIKSGPDQQPTTDGLSTCLRMLGLRTFRLKTGTPPRVLTDTVDFSKCAIQPGTDDFVSFSYETKEMLPASKQVPCYLTYTTPETHKWILDNLHRSSMYSGVVKGVGPRYCPSIEDKLVRFRDKERHQIFLEPESASMDSTYIQGFSTSLPYEIQEHMVHSLPGLEHAVIKKYAYAIEYDAIDPLQLKLSLETKMIHGLYCAGQINGTSGYEEAAGQGLIAGINAALSLEGRKPLVLRRDEAYIGVMIDDLVTKGTKEPYRLLTSRAEYRLLLRHDNADRRLSEYGYGCGLIQEERYQHYRHQCEQAEALKENLKAIVCSPKSAIQDYLQQQGLEPLKEGVRAYELVRRPGVHVNELIQVLGLTYEEVVAKQVEIEIKYEGYIEKAKREAKHLLAMEQLLLPEDIDYQTMEQLSLEARQKLSDTRPVNMGQASRISGVNPSDIAVIAMYLEQRKRKEENR